MTSSLPLHSRVPHARGIGGNDLLVVQRACSLIEELGAELDAQLSRETEEAERLRLLRATTNRITRSANDAIAAYGRAQRALSTAIARDGADVDAALAMRARLQAARRDLLRALRVAGRRYPSPDSAADEAALPAKATR